MGLGAAVAQPPAARRASVVAASRCQGTVRNPTLRVARAAYARSALANKGCDHAPMTLPADHPEPDAEDACAICGRDLWSNGLPPARDGDAWICGDCDAARNFTALDL